MILPPLTFFFTCSFLLLFSFCMFFINTASQPLLTSRSSVANDSASKQWLTLTLLERISFAPLIFLLFPSLLFYFFFFFFLIQDRVNFIRHSNLSLYWTQPLSTAGKQLLPLLSSLLICSPSAPNVSPSLSPAHFSFHSLPFYPLSPPSFLFSCLQLHQIKTQLYLSSLQP